MRCLVPFVVACVLAGCGGGAGEDDDRGPGPTPTAAPPTPAQLIQRHLDRRADVFASGPVARRLGIHDVRYVTGGLKVKGRRASLDVRMDYRVEGVASDFGNARSVRARRGPGGWRVDLRPAARNVDPWEVADYRRVELPHFVVWTPRGVDVPELALEEGYDRLRANLSQVRLRDRYLVVIAADAPAALELTQTIGGVESLTALTDTQVQVEGPALRVTDIKSQRLILVNSRFAQDTLDGQISIVAHELTHAAMAPETSGRVPAWLVEGLAEYVSQDDRRSEADSFRSAGIAPTLASLSAPDAIGRLGGDLQSAAYAEASSAAYNIAERYGRDKLLELYAVFGKASLPGARGSTAMVQKAMLRVLGIRLEDLQ